MRVYVHETITEIEATKEEIGASQTIAGRFAALLANALTPYREDEEETEEEENAERG